MKTLCINASPYANVSGTISVPENLPQEQWQNYVSEHFNDIKFGEPELDYRGVDLEIESCD